jgi:hypothetical protein
MHDSACASDQLSQDQKTPSLMKILNKVAIDNDYTQKLHNTMKIRYINHCL